MGESSLGGAVEGSIMWQTGLNGGAAGMIHLVVSKARPPEVTSGVALPLRFGAEFTDSGDPAEPCNRPRTLSPGFQHAQFLIRTTAKALHESTGMLQIASLISSLHHRAAGGVRLAQGKRERG